MRVVRIHLENFRNIQSCVLDPEPGFNVIHGRNGQGKTNLLEAIYLVATLKSFRAARNRDLVHWESRQSLCEAMVERRSVQRCFRVLVDGGGRSAEVDDKRIRKLGDYFGHFNVVLFTPEDLEVTKGEPGVRRRYVDRAVFNTDERHVELLREYEQALRSRNALIRETNGAHLDRALLAAFDEPLAQLAARVVAARLRMLEGLREPFAEILSELNGEAMDVQFRYRSSVGSVESVLADGMSWEEGLAEATRSKLKDSVSTDQARGYTGVGPHMDDIVATVDGHPLRRFGSQGQHRAFVLSLKLAEVTLLERLRGFRPILLLDDVSSELDEERGRRFMAMVEQRAGQVFVTTTDVRHTRIQAPFRAWHLREGEVTIHPDPGE